MPPTDTPTVGDAMITDVKRSDRTSTVRDLRALFANDHVHAAVIVDDGRLLTVVDRADLDGLDGDVPAVEVGALGSRVVGAEVELELARQRLLHSGRRRLAVCSGDGTFLGLLCLKRTRAGFCADHDLRARSAT